MVLADVKVGTEVSIENLSKIDKKLRRRLTSLGFHPGCKLCMKQKAMCNGPCTLESKGQLISIRNKDASLIEVRAL